MLWNTILRGNAMALYLDPPNVVLSPNMMALDQITNFLGLAAIVPEMIGEDEVFKLTFEEGPFVSFGATRICEIANTLPDKIVLSAHSSDFVLPNGLKITEVQGAILFQDSVQLAVWDQTDCNGRGYHVFDTAGHPIPQPSFLCIFHELSHAYHNAKGTSPGTAAAQEHLAITETNMLSSELGLPLRDPNNGHGGCGPGLRILPSRQIVQDLVDAVGIFLESTPRNFPLRQEIEDSLCSTLFSVDPFMTRALTDSTTLRTALEVAIIPSLRSFYKAARLIIVEKAFGNGSLQQQLDNLLAELPRNTGEHGAVEALIPTISTPDEKRDILRLFIRDPYVIVRRSSDQLASGSSTVEVSRALQESINAWGILVRSWEPQATIAYGNMGNREGLSIPFPFQWSRYQE